MSAFQHRLRQLRSNTTAVRDALATAQMQLRTEHAATDKLKSMGHTFDTSLDFRLACGEIVRLSALVQRLEARLS